MHRIFLTINICNALFLCAALVLGYLRHPQHMLVALFANVSAIFAFSLAMALFMGVAKLIKEHVGRYDLDSEIIARLNAIYHPLLTLVLIATSVLVAVGLLGALLGAGWVPVWLHGVTGLGALLMQVYGTARVYKLQTGLHHLVDEVARLVPATQVPGSPAEGNAKPGFVADELDWQRRGTRGRAFLGIGVSVPLIAAYVHIVLFPLGYLWIPVGLAAGLLIGVGGLRLATLSESSEPSPQS